MAARDRLRTAEAMTQKQFGELLARREAVRATYAKAAANYDALLGDAMLGREEPRVAASA